MLQLKYCSNRFCKQKTPSQKEDSCFVCDISFAGVGSMLLLGRTCVKEAAKASALQSHDTHAKVTANSALHMRHEFAMPAMGSPSVHTGRACNEIGRPAKRTIQVVIVMS